MSAIYAAPKPVARDDVLRIANDVLQGHAKERGEFGKWFEKNGDAFLERVNA